VSVSKFLITKTFTRRIRIRSKARQVSRETKLVLSINPAPLPPPTLHSFRRLHSIDIGTFLTDLKSSQLISDPPKSSCLLTTPLYLLCSTNMLPSSTNSPGASLHHSNPWFTATLRAFRSTLRHAENIWRRTHSAADWSSFKSLRNQYHKLILSSKKGVLLQPRIFSLRQPQTSLANSQQTHLVSYRMV